MTIFRIILLIVSISSCSAQTERSTPILFVTPARIEAWTEQQVDVSCQAKNMPDDFYLKWYQFGMSHFRSGNQLNYGPSVSGQNDLLLTYARNQDTLPLKLVMKKPLNGTRVVCKAFKMSNDVQLASTGYHTVHVKEGLTPGIPTGVMPLPDISAQLHICPVIMAHATATKVWELKNMDDRAYPRMSITPDRGTVEGRVGDAIELLCHCENLYPFSTIHWMQIKGYYEAPLNGTKDNYLLLKMNLTKLDNGTTVYCRTGFKEPIKSREIKIRVLPAPEPIKSAVSMLQLQVQQPRYPIFTLTPNATRLVVKAGEGTEYTCRVDNVVNTSRFRLSWNQRTPEGKALSYHVLVEEYKSLNLTLKQTWQASDNRSFIYCSFFQEDIIYTSPFIEMQVVNGSFHGSYRRGTTYTSTTTWIIVSSALAISGLLIAAGVVTWFCCCRQKSRPRSRMPSPSFSNHDDTTYDYAPVEIVDFYKAKELATRNNAIRNNVPSVPALPARNRREENIYTPIK